MAIHPTGEGNGNSLGAVTGRLGWVAGTDGGQTKTVTVLADLQGHALVAGWAGPANHINESGGPERCRRAVLAALQSAAAAYARRNGNRLNPPVLLAAAYGMSGGNPQMAEIIRSVIQAEHPVVVVHDSMNAWMGALAGQAGAIVIGGTGSVGYGRDLQGREALSGGWGHLMGDEGSGYWLASQGLTAATEALDGRGPATLLTETMLQVSGKRNWTELHDWIYGQASRPEYAGLGRGVAVAAARGDQVAGRLLEQAGVHLGRLAVAVIHRLRSTGTAGSEAGVAPGAAGAAVGEPVNPVTDPAAPLPVDGEAAQELAAPLRRSEQIRVSYAGGVFAAGPAVLEPFARAVQEQVPAAEIAPPCLPPVGGSLLLAYRSLGLPITDTLLENLKQTLPGVLSATPPPAAG